MVRRPFESLETDVSRKKIVLSFSISMVKRIAGFVSNGYPSSFVRKLTKTTRPTANKEPTQEFKSTAALPYIKGVSEVLRRCLQQQGVRTVFKSGTTLRSHLVRPKDALEPTKIRFHVSAAKYTSGKQGERCKTG